MGVDVTVVEYMPNIFPVEDVDVSKQMERTIKKQGLKIMTNSSVELFEYFPQPKQIQKLEFLMLLHVYLLLIHLLHLRQ